jgi:hypothetical protein
MTEPNQPNDETPGDAFKEDHRGEGPLIDPTDFISEESLSSEFDHLLQSFVSEQSDAAQNGAFSSLNETGIQQGLNGLLPPELNGESLGPDEIAFGINAGEFQTIVKTLSYLLKFQPPAHRRCRLLIEPDGVTWHANEGNGFIEYFTAGHPTNFNGTESRVVIAALNDLQSAARAARDIATFRIRNGLIQFTAHRFERPILTHSPKTFSTHTDTLRLGVDLNVPRPEVRALTIRNALAFLGTIAPSEEAHPRLNLIEIKSSVARAIRPEIGAQVESSAFDGLNITFKPRFLRWILPALKLRANFQAWHGEAFCIIRNDQLTFGFELVHQELSTLPQITLTDTLLTPANALKTFVGRAVRMFGDTGWVIIQSDERGGNSPLPVSADDAGQSPRRLEMLLSANRDGEHTGPFKVTVKAQLLLQALRMSSDDANTEISISKKAIYIDNPLDDAKFSVIVSAQVQL